MDVRLKYTYNQPLDTYYDAVVVGAGPAGSAAALALARAGFTTLLVERKKAVGQPVRCAEGVPRGKFESLVGPADRRWVSADVNGGVGVSPSGITVRRDAPAVGYILNREIFDRVLFARAADAGAATVVGMTATAVTVKGDNLSVDLYADGVVKSVTCRALIGADGVESAVGRAVGLPTALNPSDLDICAEYVLAGANREYPDYIQFFLGRRYAPGGYAWVFPKEDASLASVGVGITPTVAGNRNPFYFLDAFVTEHFPNAKVLEVRTGAVPVAKPLSRFVTERVALVGDAARQTDPFSGEGICQALAAGQMAGAAVARGLAHGNLADELSAYQETWRRDYGERYLQHYKVRQVILAMTDDEIDDTVAVIRDKIDIANIKGSEVFATFLKALWKNPKILLKLRHLLT